MWNENKEGRAYKNSAFLLKELFITSIVGLFGLVRHYQYCLVPCCHDFGHHQQKQTL
jgi:hypothetical protein